MILKQEFLDSNNITPTGFNQLGHDSNFFIGNDPNEWRTNVANFQEIIYLNIYDGIDLRYYSNDDDLK